MTPSVRQFHLGSVALALRQHHRDGCQFAVGPGGNELEVYAPTVEAAARVDRLIAYSYYDVLEVLHDVEAQQNGVRRCRECRDRLPPYEVDICHYCAHGRVTFERLGWLAYRTFDIPTLFARFN